MRISIRLFALQRQQIGSRQVIVELPDGATVRAAWEALATTYPIVAPAGPVLRFARNGVYADAGERLSDGDELAIIPPVSGGGDPAAGPGLPHRRIELREVPFDDALSAELSREVAGPDDGAVVIFVGQTRQTPGSPAPGQEAVAARFAGHAVERLSYEAFESMTLSILSTIADEIEARFGVRHIAILHRLGDVPLSEASVIIATAAPHREEAFAACRYAIEELKARAPIWKSEHFADGSVWMGAPARTGP